MRYLLLCIALTCLGPAVASATPAKAPPADKTPQKQVTTRPARAHPIDREAEAAPPSRLRRDLTPMLQLIQQGRYGAARIRLKKYRTLSPRVGQAAFLFGLTYHKEQNYAKAKPLYQEAIQLDPTYQQTYYFMGWCLYYLGELEKSRIAFDTYLKLQPKESDAYFALGLIASDLDELDAAERNFMRAIQLLDGNEKLLRERAKTHARLGDVYVRMKRMDEARAELSQAVIMWPDHYEAHFKLYRILTRLGEEEAAAIAFAQYERAKARVRPDLVNKPDRENDGDTDKNTDAETTTGGKKDGGGAG